jgi:Zn-dependent protease
MRALSKALTVPLKFLFRFVSVGQACGVPVQVHTAWFVYPFGLLLAWGWLADGLAGAMSAVCLLAILTISLVCHEFAHVGVARRCGYQTDRVWLTPAGAVALIKRIPQPRDEISIAAAGPAVSVLLAFASS